ncbi:glyoxalase [Tenacibaculum amylolyticum]|uniref:glyoxalase n=1 Tax=Tenacibaculum amylolyticum TaxID=104269 RepID=UPI003896054D
MSKSKISIRPNLNLTSSSKEEQFQNEVLRPILKLQNDIIGLVFFRFLEKQKLVVQVADKAMFETKINETIKKNIVLRNQLLGLIIGQFTSDEFLIYKEKETEFNKRILNMIGKRITDNQSN